MRYNKPYLAVPDQLALLESRGLVVTDRQKAEHYLAKIGYYRLSGYFYVFRKSIVSKDGKSTEILDQFKENVAFDDILALYVFDKRLRLILLDAIERIEVALRVDVALQLGMHDSKAHLDRRYLHSSFSQIVEGYSTSQFQDWERKFRKAFNSSRDDFVMHFKAKYPRCDLPIWMATELWDFGMLSRYIHNMKDVYKEPIAHTYGLQNNKLLVSWLHSINDVRNICAHHGRLWNRVMATKPRYPRDKEAPILIPIITNAVPSNRIFATICIIQYFMRLISPNSNWHRRLIDLISKFPESPYVNSTMMGVKDEWQDWPLWK